MNHPALSLHDALPIFSTTTGPSWPRPRTTCRATRTAATPTRPRAPPTPAATRARPTGRAPCSQRSRSEEHTSELQSRGQLVCRLLLEKKKKIKELNEE